MDDLEELRELLLRREQEQIHALHERLDDKERRVRDVSSTLPQAIKLSRDRGGELTRALQPSVEESIQNSLEQRPEMFVEALSPIIGSLVRRSIAESLRGLIQTLNKTLEHTFSVQGLKWRYEALRTGRSFAEVVMLRSMVYRVEEIFLIHRETSLTLLRVSADAESDKDADLVAGMLSAIQDFARDCFRTGANDALDEFRIGELEVWVEAGRHAYLAAIIRGTPPRELRGMLEEAIESAHILKGAELAKFDGDAAVFEPLRPDLEACLRAQYRKETAAGTGGGNAKAWVALAGVGAVILFAATLAWQAGERWNEFIGRLNAEPGIAVTHARHRWFGASQVEGLRDGSAADPAELARIAKVDPARVNFLWKPYLALDRASVLRRFERRFPVAKDTRLSVRDDGAAVVSGAADYEWLERVRREGTQVPGVTALVVQPDLTVTYAPAPALERFRQAFPPPAGVETQVDDQGALVLSGKAPYEWVANVREGATRLPGIKRLDEKGLQPTFDPALVMRRFESRYGLPDSVNVNLRNSGVLYLSGEATHRWLERARQAVAEIPGIKAVEESGLTDLDQQTFKQSKSVIENAFIYFLPNKDNFATEGFAALSRLPDEIRLCQSAAKRIGSEISIAVMGSADGMGPESKNMDLSQRRAKAVTDFLVSCGLEAKLFKPIGLGALSPAAAPAADGAAKSAGEQSQRRVAFRVEVPLSSAAQ